MGKIAAHPEVLDGKRQSTQSRTLVPASHDAQGRDVRAHALKPQKLHGHKFIQVVNFNAFVIHS